MFETFDMLNEYQRKAVVNNEKALLINASVGSGKTTVLVSKVLYLYKVKKVPLKEMVVLTFTNKAAEEIKSRVRSFSDEDVDPRDLCYFGTFHGVANFLLSNLLPVEELGYTKDFTIIDNLGLAELYESVINRGRLNIKYKNRLEKRIESLKNGGKLYGNMKHDDEIEKFIETVKKEKLKRNVMDFDDLIDNGAKLLKSSTFKPSWVIIDEFQDTDSSQLEMVDSLSGRDTNLFAVGDPNQIIYTWRGSRKDVFGIFREKYNASVYSLPVNYRSTGTILQAASVFLDIPSSLDGVRNKGAAIKIKKHHNSFNEAIYLSDRIKDLHSKGVPYSEVAVFYRIQKQSEVFEDVFKREGIPYEVSAKKTLRDIPVLYWLFRVLKASVNCMDKDSISYAVCDRRYGLSLTDKQIRDSLEKADKGKDEKLPLIVQRIKKFREWCIDIDNNDGIEDKIYDYFDLDTYLSPTSLYYIEDREMVFKYLKKLKCYIEESGLSVFEGLKKAIGYSVLYGSQVINEMSDHEKESVKLMTLHASKGLEFKYVFISGANYGMIPLGGKFDDEEEKRLFFVGITRARDYLEISYHSNPEGYNVLPSPSPFLKMIPDELIESDDIKSSAGKLQELKKMIANNMNKNKEIHEAIRHVVHEKYGTGVIISENEETITAEFEGYGEKSFSKLFNSLKFVD